MKRTLTITADHLALLPRLGFEHDDGAYEGAPAVNIKRPYGNSDVFGDLVELCEPELYASWDHDSDLERHVGSEVTARLRAAHLDMADVLNVIVTSFLVAGESVDLAALPGTWERARWDQWVRADDG